LLIALVRRVERRATRCDRIVARARDVTLKRALSRGCKNRIIAQTHTLVNYVRDGVVSSAVEDWQTIGRLFEIAMGIGSC